MKKLKKVKMRKVNLKNEYTNEERWYCLKCIKAHNESLYCFYCCQIYFSEEEGLEDEEKIWICCDKCDRWIHLECDIKTGNNTKLKEQDYKAKSFKYSCPECRPSSVKKNTTKKEQRKATKKSLPTKSERTKKIRAGESQGKDQISEINSQQNRLQKAKSSCFENEMKMEESQDHNMGVEDSYTYQDEESKNDQLDINPKGYSVASNDSRRVNKSRKAKKSKNSREKMARNRGKLKRSHEEYSQMDYQSGIEAIKELTRYRSLKIAKEREDIVDPRSLAPKVLQF